MFANCATACTQTPPLDRANVERSAVARKPNSPKGRIEAMLFETWWGLLRVIGAAIFGYVALLVFLRTSGKRTLSKLNAFDFVITIALGSAFSNLVVSKSTPVSEGVMAMAALIGLQFAVAWIKVRSPRFQRLVKSEPTLLLYKGEFRTEAMQRERITKEEVKSAIRDSGGTAAEGTLAVILETDGSLIAISPSSEGTSALQPMPLQPNVSPGP